MGVPSLPKCFGTSALNGALLEVLANLCQSLRKRSLNSKKKLQQFAPCKPDDLKSTCVSASDSFTYLQLTAKVRNARWKID